MFFCSILDVNNQCLEWVEFSSPFLLPEGAGLKIGGAFLLATAAAWGVQMVARLIINR